MLPLTPRERGALVAYSEGKTTKETARMLGISTHTVKDHLKFARLKLQAVNSTNAVLIAARAGLL